MNLNLKHNRRDQKLPEQAGVCRSCEEIFPCSIKKGPDKTPWLQFWAPCFRKDGNYFGASPMVSNETHVYKYILLRKAQKNCISLV